MTKNEVKLYEIATEKAIKYIENTLGVTFWCYDNGFKTYRFKVSGTHNSLDITRDVMVAISNLY